MSRFGRLAAYVDAAVDLVFPAICPVCGRRLGAGRRDPLCGVCWEAIPRLAPPWCERCGLQLPSFERSPDVGTPALCHACVTQPPAFAWARAAAAYDAEAREALHAFKFGRKRALAAPLAALVAETVGPYVPTDVDALVAVPLAAARERERGFNQSVLLAARLGVAFGVPVEHGWLRRTRTTRPQTDLSAAERRGNVRGAFSASARGDGRHVALVDDVLTTGATASECARVLLAAGAGRVGVLTVARVA